MDCDFRSSGFVAECTMQVVKLFNELFGRNSLPESAEFLAFSKKFGKDNNTCKNLNSQDMYIGNRKNLDYAKIFSNKWQYRYSSPQSYLDYYTQQVWNGDIEEAKNIAGEIEIYLKEIEAKEVLPVVQTVKEKVPKKSFWAQLADGLYNLNKSFTNNLDARNRLHMKDIE